MLRQEFRTAFVFPGQGTQCVGMAEGLIFHRNPEIAKLTRRTYEEAENVLRINLASLCLSGPDYQLDIPEVTQPAILVTSIAALRALNYSGLKPDIVAGHSLGEYSALVAAGALNFTQAVRLVHSRGLFMRESGEKNPGGMVAILGLTLPDVEEICKESGAEIANVNSYKQIVISGRDSSISYVIGKLGERRAKRLRVKIAAHSSLMKPAKQDMERLLKKEPVSDPQIPFVQNVTGAYATTGEEIRRGLVNQMTGRVLWLDSVRLMSKDGIERYIEVGPGNVLSGLIKGIDPDAHINSSEEILSKLLNSSYSHYPIV